MRTALVAVLILLAFAPPAAAAPGFVAVGHFANPMYVAAPPRDPTRLFVVERGGTVRVIRGGTVLGTPFLDLSGQVATDGERGLLSIAFAPDYAASGLFYVYLAAASPLGELQIREYRRSATSADAADPASGRIVWRAEHAEASNHNGGTIAFGPDGMLWLATGDGGGADDQFRHAQDLSSPLGKLIRIDPTPSGGRSYTVPADNPYATAIWARGLRNPFRWSFDRVTGDLVIGDVGQDTREEVDWVRNGAGLGRAGDFGWACYEGFATGPTPADCALVSGYVPPVFDYSQASPRAIAGGVVVRDPGLPTLVGRYVYADSFTGDVRSLKLGLPRATDDRSAGLPHRDQIVDFGEDACGHVYVVSLTGGTVDRIQDGAVGACALHPAPTRPAPSPPPPAPAPPPADTTPCHVRLHVSGARAFARRHRLRLRLRSDEACRATIAGRVRGVARLRTVRRSLVAARPATVTLRLNRRGTQRLRRAFRHHRALIVSLRVRTVDSAANRGTLTRRLRVGRR